MPKKTFWGINENTVRHDHNPIFRVNCFLHRVTFHRSWGKSDKGEYGPYSCDVEREYEQVSFASLDRLHRVISQMVNDNQAEISLGNIGPYGICYEVEIG